MSVSVEVVEAVTVVEAISDDVVSVLLDDQAITVDVQEAPGIVVDIAGEGIEVDVQEAAVPVVIEITREETVPDRTTLLDDVGGGVTYVGKAAPGSATDDPVWQIQKITEGVGVVEGSGDDLKVEWADKGDGPNANFDKVWDDRVSYSYG
jgi:hypothetical protein